FIILLLVEGMYLIHRSDGEFHVKDGWAWTAIVALVILFASGGAILGRHAAKYSKLLAQTPDGPISDDVRKVAIDPTAFAVSHMNTGLALGVVYNMVNKPGTAGSIVVLVVGIVVGTGIGLVIARGGAARTG
ncbi:MAG: hypothetical protein JWN31_490, partial [Frankiales bacterium]|nr:hypothetical protein [Frankiales bacterium]